MSQEAVRLALTIARGIRNGAYYGTKIRAPHGRFKFFS
jgi:hypothetical protein